MQSTILAAIPNRPHTRSLWDKACHIVFSLFSNPSFTQRCFQLALGAAPTYCGAFVLLSVIVSYFSSQQGGGKAEPEEWFNEAYLKAVNCFISSVLGSRERPDMWVMGSCSGLFKRVTHAMFKDLFLTAMKKALLRNPEELMSGMA